MNLKLPPMDFQAEATAFVREHSCPPVAIIKAAMERGAELAVQAVKQTLHELNENLEERRQQNLSGH
jgi:hypothetical protein